MGLNHTNLYELGAPLGAVGLTERFEARNKATGTRVVVHRIAVPGGNADMDDVRTQLTRWAPLSGPVMPLLADAWEDSGTVYYVTHEHRGVALASPDAKRLLEPMPGGFLVQAARQTLAALAILHEANITHKELTAPCFIVAKGGIVCMVNTALWSRINRSVTGGAGVAATGFMLASNMLGRDVADWALLVAGLACDRTLIPEDIQFGEARIPVQIDEATSAMKRAVKDARLAGFLARAMRARAEEDGGMDNAHAALEQFDREVAAP